MSENKNNIENTNIKSDSDVKQEEANTLLNSIASPLEKISSIEIGTDYLKQNISPNYNSGPDGNSNQIKNENNSFPENKNLVSNQNNPTALPYNSPYAAYYTSPTNYPNPSQNYNYYNQYSVQGNPGYQPNYANSAGNYQTPSYPQQYPQGYYNYAQGVNYPYGQQNPAFPQQNLPLNTNYLIPNANNTLISNPSTNLNPAFSAASSPVYYQLPQGNLVNQQQMPNYIPNQLQNQNQYPIQAPTQPQSQYQIPPSHNIVNLIPNQPQIAINNPINDLSKAINPNASVDMAANKDNIDIDQNSNTLQNQPANANFLSAANQSIPPQNIPQQLQPVLSQNQIYNQNMPFSTAQAPLYYNQIPLPTTYQIPIASQINPIPVPTASEPESYGYVKPYIKLLYNGTMACTSGLVAKLLTLNINILGSKNSIEYTQFPEKYRKILSNFSSTKALAAIFPFSLSLVLWDYSKKLTDIVFHYDEKYLYEKYSNGNIDFTLYGNVYGRNFCSAIFMGYLLSKPLNLFDSIILGISHTLDVKGEKIDEKIIRQNIKDGYYEKFYNKLHNYSLFVYSMKFGMFFGFFDSIKFFNKEYRHHNFFVNFKLAFLLSMFTNMTMYPYEIARQKFAYDFIYHNYSQLKTSEPIKKEPFFKEFKEIIKNTSYVFRDNSLRTIGNGMFNRIFPSFFTAFAVAIYENYRY